MLHRGDKYLRIAVPSPLLRYFDYLPPKGFNAGDIAAGSRVRVPFGRQRLIGIVVETRATTEVPANKLKAALEVLDRAPVISDELIYLARWAARYYHTPPGAVFEALLPVRLRKGDRPDAAELERFSLTDAGRQSTPDELARAPRQARLLALLQRHDKAMSPDELAADGGGWRQGIKGLVEKGLVIRETATPVLPSLPQDTHPELGEAQQQAVDAVTGQLEGFQAWLLEGITGSGKTEVYLHIIEQVVASDRQALVLVPEIGLTPQLLDRFRQRLRAPIAVSHSGLNDTERLAAWAAMASGEARVMIGTRSAVFAPLPKPGIIIIDEEHDASFKQQEGFRYSARDLAVVRAQRNSIPILLGSATPSLESLANVAAKRYRKLALPERAGDANPPSLRLVDIRGQRLTGGLSDTLVDTIRRHLGADGQVMLFLNRRGYAPRLLCGECGWLAQCRRCDAQMTLHQKSRKLQCHHCGAEASIPQACPDCQHAPLDQLGRGTERLDETLRELFPDESIARVDRDTTTRKGSLDRLLDEIRSGKHRLLVGTQMLAKGHDFPRLTMVGVLNADHGLFGLDFRAAERMAQLIVQVAGRAGRADRAGEVLVQTHHPEHPLLRELITHGYDAFAQGALQERKNAMLPPFASMALLRAESPNANSPREFLSAAKQAASPFAADDTFLLGPAPAPMERRAGRYRSQLLIQSNSRAGLQNLLTQWTPLLETLPEARKARWSLDVDPADLF